jgi:hypothetical protein
LPTAHTVPPAPPPGPAKPDPLAAAKAATDEVWEYRKSKGEPVPATPYIGVAKVLRRFLDAGYSHDDVVTAALRAPTISTGAVEFQLRGKRREVVPIDQGRADSSGRVAL